MSFRCRTCDLMLKSSWQYERHMTGRSHAKKLKEIASSGQDYTCDRSVTDVSTATTPCETDTQNPLAAVMKSETDRHTDSGPGIKAEPVDQDATSGVFHQFQSVVKREGDVNIKCESCTCVHLSSSPVTSWNVMCHFQCERSEVKFHFQTESISTNINHDVVKTEAITANISSDVIKTEAVTANISSDVIKTEPVTANISSDVIKTEPVTANISSVVIKTELVVTNISSDVIKTEPVTENISSVHIKTEPVVTNIRSDVIKTEPATENISSDVIKTDPVTSNTSCDVQTEKVTITPDAVSSESTSSRDEDNGPAGDNQKQVKVESSVTNKTTPQLSASEANRTPLHMSAYTSGSLMPDLQKHIS
ncbi:uncharacterized protein LOC143277222 isoform X2 [Babylonia areolata]|uniref:uncharacterized protein LOC143277222 isoform X2 n=1 Tax=Babylonia areolata TaxID=304850 RepID=UPI003FD1E12F